MSNDDFIETFIESIDKDIPYIYRLFGGISILTSTVKNRVFIDTKFGYSFPNNYIFLIGTPSSAKGLIVRKIRDILNLYGDDVWVVPRNVTFEAMIDRLHEDPLGYPRYAKMRKDKNSSEINSATIMGKSLYILVDELSQFFDAKTDIVVPVLTDLWDNVPAYDEKRRTNKKEFSISFPCINMLVAGQPPNLLNSIPKTAWERGFFSRTLLVYNEENFSINTLNKDTNEEANTVKLLSMLRKINSTKNVIELEYTDDFFKCYTNLPKFEIPDTYFKYYANRRQYHFIKMAIVSAVSRMSPTIQDIDCKRSVAWLQLMESNFSPLAQAMLEQGDSAQVKSFLDKLFKDKDQVSLPEYNDALLNAFGMTKAISAHHIVTNYITHVKGDGVPVPYIRRN